MKHSSFVILLALVVFALPTLACDEPEVVGTEEPALTEAPVSSETLVPEPSAAAAQAGSAAQKPATPAAPATPPAARPKFVAPIRGTAEIGYLKPATKVVNNEVITTIRIKNLSTGAIAGLRLDEYWWDAAGNTLPGDSRRLKQPLLPGEEATIELRVPKDPKMHRNSYQFTHANGDIKARLLPKF